MQPSKLLHLDYCSSKTGKPVKSNFMIYSFTLFHLNIFYYTRFCLQKKRFICYVPKSSRPSVCLYVSPSRLLKLYLLLNRWM